MTTFLRGGFSLSSSKCFRTIANRRRQLVEMCWDDIAFEGSNMGLNWHGSKTKIEIDLPLTDDLAALFEVLKRQTEAIHKIKPSDQIFNVTLFNRSYRGNRMTVEQFSGFFSRLSSKSSGGRISSNRIRHAGATQLGSKRDANLYSLQRLLGHKDIRMTKEYVAVNTNGIRELLENADKFGSKTPHLR